MSELKIGAGGEGSTSEGGAAPHVVMTLNVKGVHMRDKLGSDVSLTSEPVVQYYHSQRLSH